MCWLELQEGRDSIMGNPLVTQVTHSCEHPEFDLTQSLIEASLLLSLSRNSFSQYDEEDLEMEMNKDNEGEEGNIDVSYFLLLFCDTYIFLCITY